MFDAEIVALVAGVRGMARGRLDSIDFALPNFTLFMDGRSGFSFNDPTKWAQWLLMNKKAEVELRYMDFPGETLTGHPAPRSYSIYREQAWLVIDTQNTVNNWCQISWVVKDGEPPWKVGFANCSAMPDYSPNLSLTESIQRLDEALKENSVFSAGSEHPSWAEEFDMVRDVLLGRRQAVKNHLVRAPQGALNEDARRLLTALQVIPKLTGMGGWSDGPFEDETGFERCITMLAEARLRAYEACANSAYADFGLVPGRASFDWMND